MFRVKTSNLVYTCVASIIVSLFFFGPTDNWRWDPSYYYAQMRSPLIERDVDIGPEVIPQDVTVERTVNGLWPSPWPIGPGLLWTPFFLIAQLYLLLTGSGRTDGFDPLTIAAVSGGSALYGVVGLIIVYRCCRLFTDRSLALLATVLTLAASPLFFYLYRQPIMAHSTSFAAAAGLLYICLLIDQERLDIKRGAMLLGVFVGLNVIVRWTSAICAIMPGVLLLGRAVDALRQRDRAHIRRLAVQAVIIAATAFVVILPQLAFWYRLHGAWIVFPSGGFSGELFPWNALNIYISTNRGIVFWAPFVVLGIVGLTRLPNQRIRWGAYAYVLLLTYVLGVWRDWNGGGGYGPRYFIELLPLAAIGFCTLVRPVWERQAGRRALVALAVVLIGHQFVLMTTVEHAWIPLQEYQAGASLGIRFQFEGAWQLIQAPLTLIAARPYVGIDRQTIVANLLAGTRDLHAYLIPLIGTLVIAAGILGCALLGRLRASMLATAFATVVVCSMLGWFGYLLILS